MHIIALIMNYALGWNKNTRTATETDEVSPLAALTCFFVLDQPHQWFNSFTVRMASKAKCSTSSLREESFPMVKGLLKQQGSR